MFWDMRTIAAAAVSKYYNTVEIDDRLSVLSEFIHLNIFMTSRTTSNSTFVIQDSNL